MANQVNITWTKIYGLKPEPGYQFASADEAFRYIKVMLKTSVVHTRDFHPRKLRAVKDKINNATYMKMAVGYDSITNKDVVIIYHRLNHTLYDFNVPDAAIRRELKNAWSVSVGVDPAITSKFPTGSTPPPDNSSFADAPYAQLAGQLIEKLYSDAKTTLYTDVDGPGAIVIYDDIYLGASGANFIANPIVRRSTAIGEIGWVAEQMLARQQAGNPENYPWNWRILELKKVVSRPLWDNPKTAQRERIPGWGRDDPGEDLRCIRTSLKPL